MNDAMIVTTNGSWVTMIMKTSAGINGARRAQSPVLRSSRLGEFGGTAACRPGRTSVSTLMTVPSLRFSRAIPLRHVVGERLPAFQGLVDAHPAGDRRA